MQPSLWLRQSSATLQPETIMHRAAELHSLHLRPRPAPPHLRPAYALRAPMNMEQEGKRSPRRPSLLVPRSLWGATATPRSHRQSAGGGGACSGRVILVVTQPICTLVYIIMEWKHVTIRGSGGVGGIQVSKVSWLQGAASAVQEGSIW